MRSGPGVPFLHGQLYALPPASLSQSPHFLSSPPPQQPMGLIHTYIVPLESPNHCGANATIFNAEKGFFFFSPSNRPRTGVEALSRSSGRASDPSRDGRPTLPPPRPGAEALSRCSGRASILHKAVARRHRCPHRQA